MSPICPKCRKDDLIKKLSTVIKEGSMEGTFSGPSASLSRVGEEWAVSGGYTTVHGTVKSQLAKLLEPPLKPNPPPKILGKLAKSESKLGKPAMLIIIIIGVLSILVGLLGFVGSSGGNLFCIGFGILITIVAIYNLGNVDMSADEKAYQDLVKKWERDYQQWKDAISDWQSYYYCERDDIVFNPDTNETIPPERLRSTLTSW
jgi:hypothetical protein